MTEPSWLETTRATVAQHDRDGGNWWVATAYGLLDEIDKLTSGLKGADAYLSDNDGAPIDCINLARGVIRDTLSA